MPEKGKSNNPKGKPKGTLNKTTVEFKQAINKLLEHATPKMIEWLEEVAKKDEAKALEIIHKMAEYAYPKLARTEFAGDEDNPIRHSLKVEFMKGQNDE